MMWTKIFLFNRLLRAGIFIAIIACLPAVSHAQYAYDITNLGSLGGPTYPYGINNKGQVVGVSYSTQFQQDHAFLYSNEAIQDLFPQKFNASNTGAAGIQAQGINDRGQIIGESPNGAYVYDPLTQVRHDLFNPARYGFPLGINQNGLVTGNYQIIDTTAYLYDSNTGIRQDIGMSQYFEAYALNNVGQVTGYIYTSKGLHASIYSNGVIQDIGTFPGASFSEGQSINGYGDVVGYSDHGNATPPHAFLYHNGVMQDIGLLHSYDNDSYAYGINNAGDVVGQSGFTGFLYHNGTMQALDSLVDPSLGWRMTSATAINERGQIIGYGNQGAFLMTPHRSAVPAPGSLLVCGLGGGLLVLRLRRKRS